MMNHKIDPLFTLRKEVERCNKDFFALLEKRKLWVEKIQEEKKKNSVFLGPSPYIFFDAEREFELFAGMKDRLMSCSLKELLSFSLVMEDQILSRYPGTYPAWSEKVHISKKHHKTSLFEMINPLLLYHHSPESLAQLTLKPSYSKFIQDRTVLISK